MNFLIAMKHAGALTLALFTFNLALHLEMPSCAAVETNSCSGPGLCQHPNDGSEISGGVFRSELEAATEAWCYAVCAEHNIDIVSQLAMVCYSSLLN